MRPIRLEVQGLTSFREKAEVDFTDLDLFAITGHTGAGKSSLVDAITYALFGEVPRVGDSIKQLISQGEDRLRVNLEFSADGGRYRVHRSTGHKGVPAVQMEHLDPATGEWLPDADKVKEVNEHVASILGMDYEGFVRSILLPQGQFQQFLAGKPEERRKVLDGLLRLDLYQLMQQRSNQIAEEHTGRAAGLQQQLDTQYADATPEALKAAKERLAGLRAEAEALAALRVALSDASSRAEAMSGALRRKHEAEAALARARGDLEREQQLLDSGQKLLSDLSGRMKTSEVAIKESVYDVDLLMRLQQALDLAQRLDRTEKRLAQAREHLDGSGPRLEKLRADAAMSSDALKAASAAAEEAERLLQETRRENLAGALRKGLRPGDPCPVCGQKVGPLPEAQHEALDRAEEALKSARAGEAASQKRAQDARTAVAVAEREAETLAGQLKELAADCETERKKLQELLPGQEMLSSEIAALVRAQTTAKQEHDRLTRELDAVRKEREAQATAIAGAGQAVARLQAEIESRNREINAAAAETTATEAALREAAKANDWPDVAACIDSDQDPVPPLRRKQAAADAEVNAANQQIGACEKDIGRIEEGIERAKDLRTQIDEATREMRLARDLAQLLRVTALPSYIRERALRILAQDGSRQLSEISGGRYEFAVEGQEFLVVDHWNLDDKRSVKTLSGGETFLASLALALALAERLPGFGAGDRAHTLESLFIDEGFSNLDAETLDIVAGALEAIGQGGNRMVGVVTHLPALAERMPARITVHKSQTGSTVTVD
ncbi:MAG TPA: SMC family ATPase [Dehalococcoidia bacterium]|nr:SMC family ATPase [Dehalococcoidia bacterium]